MPMNTEILLKAQPQGALLESHFETRESPIPEIAEGQILVRTILISLDAANRAWMQGATYREQVMPGDVMHAYGVGEVIESRSEGFSPGEIILGLVGWAGHTAMDPRQTIKAPDHRPLTHLLSVLGIAGLTAYHGLLRIGEPKAGETVVVSAAAGSVGVHVGQIAKILGARTVGIAGGPEKCAWLKNELGYDGAVDYKAGKVAEDLKAACPKGIDVYFDNVGGPILEAALFQMNLFGRIVCCGAISQYDTDEPQGVAGVPGLIVMKRLKMQGFIVMDFARENAEAIADLSKWASEGRIKVIEDVIEGLENAPKALIGLLHGENRGKRMVRVAPDPAPSST